MTRVVAASCAALLLFVACGGGEDPVDLPADRPADTSPAQSPPPADSAQPKQNVTVAMTDNLTFEPAEVVVKVGGKVTWTNASELNHTSTADKKKAADPANVKLPAGAKAWNSRFVKPGRSFTLRFDEPGTYRYFCIPHEKVGMTGVIEVVE